MDIHLTLWGPAPSAQTPPVFLLHGFQDSGEMFQFMVDAFEEEWPLVAPDWRGFGRSAWGTGSYWFPDYLADLDVLLDRFSPAVPARLVGHSMGGSIACQYAGLRPQRVRSVVNLEGLGLPRTVPDEAPAQLGKWLDQVKSAPTLKHYDSFDQLAAVIRFRYPRFSQVQADFAARCWGTMESNGRVHLLGDARHRWVNPILYRREEAEAMWRRIEAPVLLVLGRESEFVSRLGEDGTDAAFQAHFRHLDIAHIEGAGHMLHIEKADTVASVTENFLRQWR